MTSTVLNLYKLHRLIYIFYGFAFASGLGLGLIFLPGVVIVGFWFEKKRALAMGLASSGAGLGWCSSYLKMSM